MMHSLALLHAQTLPSYIQPENFIGDFQSNEMANPSAEPEFLIHTMLNEPSIQLEIDDKSILGASRAYGRVEVTGASQLEYMTVSSGNRYGAIRLGYDEYAVYTNRPLDVSDPGFQYLELVLKDMDNTNWNTVEFRFNDKGGVKVGDYLNTAVDLGDGWFKIKLPLSQFVDRDNLQFISFPNTFGAEMAVKDISFTGSKTLQWFGDRKFDNAFKENRLGQYGLVFDAPGVFIEEVVIDVVGRANKLEQLSMPYDDFSITLGRGENKVVARAIDSEGNVYYSDTVVYEVSDALTYDAGFISCNGDLSGYIDVTMLLGTAPYTYQWSNGADTEDLAGVGAGAYQLEVTDAEGRKAYLQTILGQPNLFNALLSADGCSATTRILSVAGGKAPYSYSIDDGELIPFSSDSEEVWRLEGSGDFSYSGLEDTEVDRNDNVFVAGRFNDVVFYDADSLGTRNEDGIYLMKISNVGRFEWGVWASSGEFGDMVVDKQGNVTLVMKTFFANTILHGLKQDIPLNADKGYVIQLDADGTLNWIKELPKDRHRISVDDESNIYVAGKWFGGHFPSLRNNRVYGGNDLFLAKFSPAGDMQWVKHLWGRNGETAEGLYVNDLGNIYLAGGFESEIHFDDLQLQASHHMDVFVAKFNKNGEAIWANRAGGSTNDDYGKRIIESHGGVYVTMQLLSTTSTVGSDAFNQPVLALAKLSDINGQIDWAKAYVQIEGYPTFDITYDLNCSDEGIVYVTGETAGSYLNTGSGYEPYFGSYLLNWDNMGNVLAVSEIGGYTYGSLQSPLAVTYDNHLVHCDLRTGLAIVKKGSAMTQRIEIDENINAKVTVKDRNSCVYSIEDLAVTPMVEQPSLCYAGLDPDGSGNQVVWTPAAGDVAKYNIYRSTADADFEKIGEASAREAEFLDRTVQGDGGPYTYQVTAEDVCSNESAAASIQALHLDIKPDASGHALLSWSDMGGIASDGYQIYKGTSPDKMALLSDVPSGTGSYTDVNSESGAVYYRIAMKNPERCALDTRSAQRTELNKGGVASNLVAWKNDNTDDSQRFVVYPNPGKEMINVEFLDDAKYELTLIDTKGRVVRKMTRLSGNTTISREATPVGIYTLIIRSDDGESTRKAIIFE